MTQQRSRGVAERSDVARREKVRTSSRKRRRSPWIPLAVVVGLAAVVAFFAARSPGGQETPGVSQTQPVTVTGTPLPALGTGADPAVGRPIPEVRGATFDGTPVNVVNDGRPKLLVFAAHWCPHCQRELPRLVEHLKEHPVPEELQLVAIATGTTPQRPNYPPSAWLARVGWTAPTLADSPEAEAARAFGLESYPYFVAVDRQGRVASRVAGEITAEQFDRLVDLAMR